MIILDTSVWIEFLRGREPCLSEVTALLENGDVLSSEPVFAELLQGARDKHERDTILAFWENLPKADERGMLLRAGLRSGLQKWYAQGVGLIDAAVATLAADTGSPVWTLDQGLKGILPAALRYK
jgi:predicted nucleic acid-binding protein